MILDVVIVAALALAAYGGWRSGFVGPAIAQIGAIAVLVIASRSAFVAGAGAWGVLIALAVATAIGPVAGRLSAPLARLMRRWPLARSADPFLGVLLSGSLAFVTAYVLTLGLVAIDEAVAPLHRASALGPAQVASLRARLAASPGLGVLAEPAGLDALQAAARAAPVPIDQLDRYVPLLGAYELKVRPQLTQSVLAGVVLTVGERIRVLGQPAAAPTDGPRDAIPN